MPRGDGRGPIMQQAVGGVRFGFCLRPAGTDFERFGAGGGRGGRAFGGNRSGRRNRFCGSGMYGSMRTEPVADLDQTQETNLQSIKDRMDALKSELQGLMDRLEKN